MKLTSINHVCVIVRDMAVARPFYATFLGLKRHKEEENWFRTTAGFTFHLIEIDEATTPSTDDMHHYYRHVAFEVPALREVVASALLQGFSCFQMDTEGEEHDITDVNDPLTFGLRTVFVRDPDRNLFEFVQRGFSWPMLWK